MKLDHDCVRDILLWLEENCQFAGPQRPKTVVQELSSKYEASQIKYCIQLLTQIGYINGGITIAPAGPGHVVVEPHDIQNLTWEGHEYLDTIRDSTVWEKTKDVASSLKSVSLRTMGTIASQIVIGLIKQKTGLPL